MFCIDNVNSFTTKITENLDNYLYEGVKYTCLVSTDYLLIIILFKHNIKN